MLMRSMLIDSVIMPLSGHQAT